jgi:hypothetical protein
MCEGRDFVSCWWIYQAVKEAPLGRTCLRSLMDRAIKVGFRPVEEEVAYRWEAWTFDRDKLLILLS